MDFFNVSFDKIPTPAYVVDKELIIKNLEIHKSVIDKTGCKILLAQKAFSMFALYPLIGQYLNGTTASSLNEARLGKEYMGKEVHIYAPAYKAEEFDRIVDICDHIVFNSFSQWDTYKAKVKSAGKYISCGIRVNPEYAEVETDIYNPCATNSRLGVTKANFRADQLHGISGLHFHTMCEQNSDVLFRTLEVFEKKFGEYLYDMEWVNFGGGHHISRDDYDLDTLVQCINHIKNKYNVQVYLEPGEAIALNAGFLVAQVLDILKNNMEIAILDTSAACHMPDVLEMPYRPRVIGSDLPNKQAHTYRLAGPTCLAGDVIGDYSFPQPLKKGDRLVFCDMAIYTMVKNNTFNGVNLPAIVLKSKEGVKIVKEFGYEDFKERLS